MTQKTSTEHTLLVSASYDQKRLAPLIQQLAKVGALDSYTVRQRLIGSGLAQLAKGTADHLRPLANLLRQHHVEHWLLQPTVPQFTPQRIKGLTIQPEQIVFRTHSDDLILEHGTALLAIVADMSGQLAEKQIKRLLVHTTYSGGAPTPMDEQELHREIFKHSPVIDLYWHKKDNDDNNLTTQAVRIFPGSFDHKQLGDKTSMSRNGNLASLLEQINEYAAPLEINRHFSLGSLPDCQLHKTSTPTDHKGNLSALTRYGWLVLDITQHNVSHNDAPATPLPVAAELLDKVGLAEVTDAIVEPMTGTMAGAKTDHEIEETHSTTKNTSPQLPPPPDVETRSGIKLHFTLWRVVAASVGILVVFLSDRHETLPSLLYQYGINTGLIPALISAGSLWAAIHYWRLKRRIEATPTSKTRSAAMGMIEVHGQAKRAYALVSPISQLPCVYYCLKRYRRTNRDKQWKLSQVTTSGTVPFLLEDDSGQISIDPQGAKLSPKTSIEGFPGQSNILFTSNSEANPYEKWKEEVFHEGCTLYVMGFARVLDKGRGNMRQNVAKKLRDLKTDRNKLMRYDQDGDGNIDAAEWDQARSDMEQQVLHEKLHRGQQRSNQQLVIGAPPQKGLPFIIAETASEAHLTRNYSWYVPPLLITGVATFIWALVRGGTYFHLF
ncbi:MAG: GIDE domain-containing protein [Thermodesulfobacteriota bacterium]|nr:GIDE domain-containing protein [Thermodesulfobacteriota bacterium]